MKNSITRFDLMQAEALEQQSDVFTELPPTLNSQYSSSTRIGKLGEYIHKHLDKDDVFESMFNEVFNVETAQGVFLDYWGAIVGVKRTTTMDGVAYMLDDDAFRELIMFRTAVNVSNASIMSINELLAELFDIPIAVVDNGNMTMRIFVDRSISNGMLAMLHFYGYILKPAGVGYEIVLTYDGTFGFYGQRLQNWGFGVFNLNPIEE